MWHHGKPPRFCLGQYSGDGLLWTNSGIARYSCLWFGEPWWWQQPTQGDQVYCGDIPFDGSRGLSSYVSKTPSCGEASRWARLIETGQDPFWPRRTSLEGSSWSLFVPYCPKVHNHGKESSWRRPPHVGYRCSLNFDISSPWATVWLSVSCFYRRREAGCIPWQCRETLFLEGSQLVKAPSEIGPWNGMFDTKLYWDSVSMKCEG